MKETKEQNRFEWLTSIRTRVFVISMIMGLLPCLILQKGILSNYEKRAVEVKTSEAQTQLRALANHLIYYNYMTEPESVLVDAELSEFSSIYDGRLLVINSRLEIITDTYQISEGRTVIIEDVVRCLREGAGAVTSSYDKEDGYITIIMPIMETSFLEEGDRSGLPAEQGSVPVQGVLMASISTETIQNTLVILGRHAVNLEFIMLVAIFIIALFLSYFLVAPLERLSRKISAVRAGYSNDPVRAPEYLETRHIAEAFNDVLARMNELDSSREEFVSNVSHELKTPMAAMKVLADSLLSEENVPAEMYREFLEDIAGEIDRENKIISELLTLIRMDRNASEMNISVVNVTELAEMVMKRVRPIARKDHIDMVLVSERAVMAEIDEAKMTMALSNLVENAVKYNRPGGRVTVTVDADHKDFTLRVEDTGIGIPEESIGRIFDRFYRVDKSRSREIGGTGLGLSITKEVVLAHYGSIKVDSAEGKGTSFLLTIPLTYVPESARPERKRRDRNE